MPDPRAKNLTIRERIERNIAKEIRVPALGACWIWQGAKTPKGYAKMSHRGRTKLVHILAYTVYTGELIPIGHVIDHLCRVHPCVNPDHLQAVTTGTNLRRGMSRWGVPKKLKPGD